MPEHKAPSILERLKRYARIAWLTLFYSFEMVVENFGASWAIVRREGELFFGTAVTIIGMLGFSSSRYCDGNTAEYLSCTRPSAFYYYDMGHIALVVLGVFYILIWFQKGLRK